jgi:hypothetical protein
MSFPIHIKELAGLIGSIPFNIENERSVQNVLSDILVSVGVNVKREFKLSDSDRIDFLVDGIGIEVKLDSSVTKMIRQLHRYARSDKINALILATADPKLINIPSTLNGKPVKVIVLSASLF